MNILGITLAMLVASGVLGCNQYHLGEHRLADSGIAGVGGAGGIGGAGGASGFSAIGGVGGSSGIGGVGGLSGIGGASGSGCMSGVLDVERCDGVDNDCDFGVDEGGVCDTCGAMCASTLPAYVKASNTGTGDAFGYSVAVHGDTMVIGAYLEGSSATGINGDQTDNNATESGAVYVFVRSGTEWTQQAYLKASNTGGIGGGAGDWFGWSVAIFGDTLVVGAPNESSNAIGINGNQLDNSLTYSGAAYVFVRSGGTWSQQAYLKASDPRMFADFGYSVAISYETIAIGAAAYDGSAYVFVRDGTAWTQQALLKGSNTEGNDNFGFSISISVDTIVVGALRECSSATGVNGDQSDNSARESGAAYVFTRSGSVWTQQAYLKASNTGVDDLFGHSVSVSSDTIVVGAGNEASSATGVNGNQIDEGAPYSGAAYVFVRSGEYWTQQAYLKASNTGSTNHFGGAVVVAGEMILVGEREEDSGATAINGDSRDTSVSNSGAVHVFVRDGNTWSLQSYLKASNTGTGDWFGYAVAMSGGTIVIGAHNEDSDATGINGNQADNSASGSGAVYVFR